MRLLVSFSIACLVALGLFLLMMYMVSNRDPGLTKSKDLATVDFIRFDSEADRTRTKDRRKPPEEPPKEPPPPSTPEAAQQQPTPDAPPPELAMPNIDTSMEFEGGPYMGSAKPTTGTGTGEIDADITPIVRVPPQYPRTAKRANIEGYVTMQFTVKPDGSVANIQVIDAQPPRMFNRAAKQALAQWKFKPRTRDGKRVSRNAQQTIRFTLDSG